MSVPASLRVLQVITDTDRRGAQVFAVDLGEGLSALGHQVTTVALTSGDRSPALPVRVLGRRARGLRTLLALRHAMTRADITIAHGSSTLLACALAGGGRRRPFVYRQISDSRFWASSWHRRRRVRAYLGRARHVVALSDSSARTLHEYLGVEPRRITVVPNAVPAGHFTAATPEQQARARTLLDLPHDAMIAAYVGALVPEKGVDTAIEAVSRTPAVHLLVVGDGPERERLERAANQLAPGRVHFRGDLADPSTAYAASDVFVLTSQSESMPAVLIEAGLCGLPAITCPVGAITDVVLHERTGLVVPSRDPVAVARALDLLISDAVFRERLGAAAAQHCATAFTIDTVAPRWGDVLAAAARGH